MNIRTHSDTVFEIVFEAHLLENDYVQIVGEDFDRERSIFPGRSPPSSTSPSGRNGPDWMEQHGDKANATEFGNLSKRMNTNGTLAALRQGFKGYRGNAPRGVLQRGEPRARSLLRHQSPGLCSTAPLLTTLREVAEVTVGKALRRERRGRPRGSTGEYA